LILVKAQIKLLLLNQLVIITVIIMGFVNKEMYVNAKADFLVSFVKSPLVQIIVVEEVNVKIMEIVYAKNHILEKLVNV